MNAAIRRRRTGRIMASAIGLCSGIAWGAYSLDWWTFDCGGGVSAGGAFTLDSSVGQWDAGEMSGGTFHLSGGFLAVVSADPGDCNGDGAVNLADWSCFAGCMHGPQSPVGSACGDVDMDHDGDVDLKDIQIWMRAVAP